MLPVSNAESVLKGHVPIIYIFVQLKNKKLKALFKNLVNSEMLGIKINISIWLM
jgi:hypothetical protein